MAHWAACYRLGLGGVGHAASLICLADEFGHVLQWPGDVLLKADRAIIETPPTGDLSFVMDVRWLESATTSSWVQCFFVGWLLMLLLLLLLLPGEKCSTGTVGSGWLAQSLDNEGELEIGSLLRSPEYRTTRLKIVVASTTGICFVLISHFQQRNERPKLGEKSPFVASRYQGSFSDCRDTSHIADSTLELFIRENAAALLWAVIGYPEKLLNQEGRRQLGHSDI
jgi:hypothetical protein